MSQKKILIVDDDRIIIKTTSAVLTAAGFQVITALDGSAAVEKVRNEPPDLMLLDMMFPPDVAHGGGVPWDGFLIISWLQRMDEAKGIPIVLLTSVDPARIQAKAKAAGVKGFLRKPVTREQLLATISQVLGSENTAPSAEQPKKRVLFVDDEGDWREVAGTYLQEAGFDVVTARDIAETFQRSQKTHLDAIVLDVNLAGENSVLLMELLKQSHPGVPIIIYTGLDQQDDAVQAMLKRGPRQYLRKGSMGELCQAVRDAVN